MPSLTLQNFVNQLNTYSNNLQVLRSILVSYKNDFVGTISTNFNVDPTVMNIIITELSHHYDGVFEQLINGLDEDIDQNVTNVSFTQQSVIIPDSEWDNQYARATIFSVDFDKVQNPNGTTTYTLTVKVCNSAGSVSVTP